MSTNKLSLYPSVRYTIKILGVRGGDSLCTPPPCKKLLPLPIPYFKIFSERFLNDPPLPHFKHLSLLPPPHPPPLPPIKILIMHYASYFSINHLTLPSYIGVVSYFCADHVTLPSSITFGSYLRAERLTLCLPISLALQLWRVIFVLTI